MTDETDAGTKPTPAPTERTEPNNLDQLLSKAVEIKARIGTVQDDLRNISAEGRAAGEKVTVICDGEGRMTDIRIDPDVAGGDPDILRELILTAVESARSEARAQSNEMLTTAVGDLPLPAGVGTLIGQLLNLR